MVDPKKAKQRGRLLKLVTTAIICFVHFSYGLMYLIVGSSIMDLAEILDSDIPTVSLYFSILQVGYTIGAFAGFVYNYINRQLTVVVLLSILGTMLALIPHTTSPVQMFVCGALIGIGMGGWDCAVNVWVVELWQDKCGPILQTACLLYTIGCMLGPLIVSPFLTPKHELEVMVGNITGNGSLTTTPGFVNATIGSEEINNITTTTVVPILEPNRRARLSIPYSLAGSVVVMGAMLLLVLFFYSRPAKQAKSSPDNKMKKRESMANRRMSVGSFMVDPNAAPPMIFGLPAKILTVLSALLIGTYFGVEMTYLQLFPTFAHYSELHLSQASAALILSTAVTAEMIMRFLSIFLSLKFSPAQMMSCNMVLINIGFLIVLFGKSCSTAMWAGNIVIGIGFASMIPNIYPFIKQYVAITNIRGTIFVSTAGIVQGLLPAVVSRFLLSNAVFLLYANILLIAVVISAFTAIITLGRIYGPPKIPKRGGSFESDNQEQRKYSDSWISEDIKRISANHMARKSLDTINEDDNSLGNHSATSSTNQKRHDSVSAPPATSYRIEELSAVDLPNDSDPVKRAIRSCDAVPGEFKLVVLTGAGSSAKAVVFSFAGDSQEVSRC